MLVADDIVSVDETGEGVKSKVKMTEKRVKVTRLKIKLEQEIVHGV